MLKRKICEQPIQLFNRLFPRSQLLALCIRMITKDLYSPPRRGQAERKPTTPEPSLPHILASVVDLPRQAQNPGGSNQVAEGATTITRSPTTSVSGITQTRQNHHRTMNMPQTAHLASPQLPFDHFLQYLAQKPTLPSLQADIQT
jgi:hypothetical protein